MTSATAAAPEPIGPDLAPLQAIPSQYHAIRFPVSASRSALVSRGISPHIVRASQYRRAAYLQANPAVKRSVDPVTQMAASQYQEDSGQQNRRLMLRLGFGAAYVVFLIGWFWATRLRSRPHRD